MDRTERTGHLASLTDDQIGTLFKEIGSPQATFPTSPRLGMVMMRVHEDAHGEVFNLGEVLVTDCIATVDGEDGWSMFIGHRPEAARMAAAIDAALAASPDSAATVDAMLLGFVEEAERARNQEHQKLAATRVQFDVQ